MVIRGKNGVVINVSAGTSFWVETEFKREVARASVTIVSGDDDYHVVLADGMTREEASSVSDQFFEALVNGDEVVDLMPHAPGDPR